MSSEVFVRGFDFGTEEQTIRASHVELFLQTPAQPPPTSSAVDPDSIVPPGAEEAVEASEDAEVSPAPAPAAPGPAAADELAPDDDEPALADPELAEALKATISAQVASLHKSMAAQYASDEQVLLDRIAALEAKVG